MSVQSLKYHVAMVWSKESCLRVGEARSTNSYLQLDGGNTKFNHKVFVRHCLFNVHNKLYVFLIIKSVMAFPTFKELIWKLLFIFQSSVLDRNEKRRTAVLPSLGWPDIVWLGQFWQGGVNSYPGKTGVNWRYCTCLSLAYYDKLS